MRNPLVIIFLAVIKVYQFVLSPDSGLLSVFFRFGCCKYYPTCSQYAYDAIRKHGLSKGIYFGSKRLIRCHPWSSGGYDPLK